MNSVENNEYVDLFDTLRNFWAYKFLLIALAVVVAVLAVVRVELFVSDSYVASGMLYVSNHQELEEGKNLSESDINTAKSMSATYREILKTREFLSEVSSATGDKYKWNQIARMTNISAVNETEIMEIAVTANNPYDAYIIAEYMVKNAPEKLGAVFQNGQITIIDNVVVPSGPVGKGTAKQALAGALLGFAIGCAIVVIKNFFDTKIHKSEDIANRYSISILGEIAQ